MLGIIEFEANAICIAAEPGYAQALAALHVYFEEILAIGRLMIIKMVKNAGLDRRRVVERVSAVNRLAVDRFLGLHEGSRGGRGGRRRRGGRRVDPLFYLRGSELQS